ncbi:MAG: CDP-alcohol phosphatidyltransferase family protein [Planctomycetota bacterium]
MAEQHRKEHHHVPVWPWLTWPNRISLGRLLLVPVVILLLLYLDDWEPARRIALGVIAVMAVSDMVDGVLARRLHKQTRLGAILDPLADKALIISAVVLLSLPGSSVPSARLPVWVVVAVVGKDLWVVIGFLVVYLVTDQFVVRPSAYGKAATLVQLVMVVSVLAAPEFNRLDVADGQLGMTVARVLTAVAGGLSVLAAVSYTRMGLRFVVHQQKPME